MEIEKVIRIVSIFLAAAGFAICIATRLMFPESNVQFPIVIILVLSITGIWRDTSSKTNDKAK